MSISSVYTFKVKVYTPKRFYLEQSNETDKEKLNRMISETIEKFITENFDYHMGLGGMSRGCGYYIEELPYTPDERNYKDDDPCGTVKLTDDGNISVTDATEKPTRPLKFRTIQEKADSGWKDKYMD